MKQLIFFSFLLSLTSCVSMKKYNNLYSSHENVNSELKNTHSKLDEAEMEKANLRNAVSQREAIIDQKEKEIAHKEERIRLMHQNDEDLKKANSELAVWINDFTSYSALIADNNKRTIMELERQNQKVNELNKSLTQKNQVNLLMVKKAKKKISDQKLLRSLEKLGIIL